MSFSSMITLWASLVHFRRQETDIALFFVFQEKRDPLLTGAFRSVIRFPGRFLADLISVPSDGPISMMTYLINVVKYRFVHRERVILWHLNCLYGGTVFTLGRTYRVWCGFSVYSRVRTDRESRRKGETKGSKGKSMGICYPRHCYARERAEGGSFRYANYGKYKIVY